MGRQRITVIKDRCVGCHTCELACALSHSSAKDIEDLYVSEERPVYRIRVATKRSKPHPEVCHQCAKPACVEACPTGACERLAPEQPVLVNEELCEAKMLCVEACPFNMMFMSADGKVAVKCDLCQHRLAEGLLPACVASCPTGALHYDDGTEVKSEKGRAVTAGAKS